MGKEKKEIGMEKLIELLNEYEKTLEPNLQIEWTEVGIKSTPEIVISKKFGFIKWLVENDKIDRKKVNFWDSIIYCVYEYYPKISAEDELLMLLSISDTPIDDLISYLK